MIQSLALATVFLLTLGACTGGSNDDSSSVRLSTLERQLGEMTTKLADIEQKVGDTAYFRPTSQGFQTIWVANGLLYVQLAKIQALDNAYKVTFEIGNPMNASFRDLRATITWGRRELRSPANDAAHRLTHDLKEELRPGSLTSFSVLLSPASGDDIASFQLKLQASNSATFRH